MKTSVLTLACSVAMLAQPAAAESAKAGFEAASIKPAGPLVPMRGIQPDDACGASIFRAVQDWPGLKLESGKVPVEVPVIGHVEMPAENRL